MITFPVNGPGLGANGPVRPPMGRPFGLDSEPILELADPVPGNVELDRPVIPSLDHQTFRPPV